MSTLNYIDFRVGKVLWKILTQGVRLIPILRIHFENCFLKSSTLSHVEYHLYFWLISKLKIYVVFYLEAPLKSGSCIIITTSLTAMLYSSILLLNACFLPLPLNYYYYFSFCTTFSEHLVQMNDFSCSDPIQGSGSHF